MEFDVNKGSTVTGQGSVVVGYLWPALLALGALAITVALIVGLTRNPGESAASEAPTTASSHPATPAVQPPPGGTTGRAPGCPPRVAGKQIVVGLADQRMVLCRDGRPVDDIPVTTGRVARGAGTPLGRFEIESHDTNRTLSGPGYTVFVHYWLHIVGDIGLHDSPWQKFPYGDTVDYKTQGSQGCIHVPPAQMRRLYSWADDGTPITITT